MEESPDKHILFIDDEEMILTLATHVLTNAGYRITTCDSGAAAIDLFTANKTQYDLVIIDMQMPGESGTEILQKLRKFDPQLKAVMTSGYFDPNSADPVTEGVQGVLPKPFQRQEILSVVESALRE